MSGYFYKKKKRIKEIFKILDSKQVLDFVCFPIMAIISLITKPFCKNIWIIAENPNEACDNGYVFFEYLRKNRPDINAYYVIDKKSKDFKKVEELGNVIQHRSLKHWIYYLNAEKIIVTQKYANPSPALFYLLHVKSILKTPRIYLKHGITKDFGELYYYNRTKFRLFICGARKEYEYIKNTFEYPEKNVVYTGFARFDNLNYESNIRNNFILIAPTWRNWIEKQSDFDEFIKHYYEIIKDNTFVSYLKENNIQLKIVLHKNMKKFKIESVGLDNIVTINHNDEVDIQELINKTDLLVTDFSSIFFDIAYRKRPIIYYQFDTEKYRKKQLAKGYFSYKDDGFGDIYDNVESVKNKIRYYIDNNFVVEEIYSKKMDSFFERKDKDNCKRILEEIEKI